MSRGCQGALKMTSLLPLAVRLVAPRGQVILTDMVALNLVIHPGVQEIVECQEALVLRDPCQPELEEAPLSITIL